MRKAGVTSFFWCGFRDTSDDRRTGSPVLGEPAHPKLAPSRVSDEPLPHSRPGESACVRATAVRTRPYTDVLRNQPH